MSSDDEGNDSVAIRVESFYGEEEVIARFAFEMGDTWVIKFVPIATLGGQSNSFSRVWL